MQGSRGRIRDGWCPSFQAESHCVRLEDSLWAEAHAVGCVDLSLWWSYIDAMNVRRYGAPEDFNFDTAKDACVHG